MRHFTDMVCTACGCVCDDLNVQVNADRIESVDCHQCPLATEWFDRLIASQDEDIPVAQVDGIATELDVALDRAVAILKSSRAPLIYGLSRSSTPGQRAAVALADRIGAIVDTTASVCHGPSIMAIQNVGESTSTLGEVKQRADLVIFWGADPVRTHPRHLERYSGLPRSQFLPRGRDDRKLVVVDSMRTASAEVADEFIQVDAGRDFELITALRCCVRERIHSKDNHHSEPFNHRYSQTIERLADLMLSCRYGVVFFGLGIAQQPIGHLTVEALLRLVAELNAATRFTARRLRIPGDVSGADAVLCWQTGFPFAVSLQRTSPRYNPGEFTITDLLRRRDVDACLIVGSESLRDIPPDAKAVLDSLTTIVLDHAHQPTACRHDVRFTTSVYGLHVHGTAYRMDEVPLALPSILPCPFPSDHEVLGMLADGIC